MKEFFFMVIGICLCLAWCSVGADGYKFINENSDEIRLIKKLLDLESKIEAKINKKDGIVDGKDQRSTGDYENFPDAKRDEIVDGKDQRSIGDYENFPAAKRDEIVDGKDQRSTADYENFPAAKKDEIVDGKDQRSTGDYENFPAAKRDEIVDGKDQRSTGDYENFPAAKKDEIVSSDVDGKDQRSTGDYENFPAAKKSNEPDYQNWYDDFNEKSKHGSKAINIKNRGQRNGNWKTQSKHGSKAINLKNQAQRHGNWKTQRKNGRNSSNSICENKEAESHQYTSMNCKNLSGLTCGRRCCVTQIKKRIIGGRDTELNEFPWHASIFKLISSASSEYICGGVLIKDDIVLTAGHCMEGYKKTFSLSEWDDDLFSNSSNIRIFIGLNNLNKIENYSLGYRIRELKFHQDYIHTDLGEQIRYDYALIRLERNTSIEPVCMLLENITTISNQHLNNCYAIGHGAITPDSANFSPILRKIEISRFVQNATCFGAENLLNFRDDSTYLSDHWCAYGIARHGPGCQFDSGSPVVCPVNNDRCSPMFVAGILSSTEGLNCRLPYTIMTKVHGASNKIGSLNFSADIGELVCDNDYP